MKDSKDSVKMAKRNFVALGFLYTVLILLFAAANQRFAGYLLVFALLCLSTGYLLGKRKMAGVYLGWLFVIASAGFAVQNGAFLSLVIVAYLAYWNYKAGKDLEAGSANTETATPQA